jgi:hypothetical protein
MDYIREMEMWDSSILKISFYGRDGKDAFCQICKEVHKDLVNDTFGFVLVIRIPIVIAPYLLNIFVYRARYDIWIINLAKRWRRWKSRQLDIMEYNKFRLVWKI